MSIASSEIAGVALNDPPAQVNFKEESTEILIGKNEIDRVA